MFRSLQKGGPTSEGVQFNSTTMFRIMGPALGIQIALGGLVTFGFIDTGAHMIWGIVLGILSLVTLYVVMKTPGRPKKLVTYTLVIGADILLQALLGFASLDTSGNTSNGIAWVHLLNAFLIFGLNFMATGMAMMGARMGQMGQGQATATPP